MPIQDTQEFIKELEKQNEEIAIKKYGKESMKEESVGHKLTNILSEVQENTLAYHWKKAEDDYPLHYFIRELNESSLK